MVQSLKGSIAFFLSPTGDILHVPLNHISTVIAEPERFGLTIEEIRAVYDGYGEPVGLEGEARREILLKIIEDGWTRLRRYQNKYWSITAPSITSAVRERLQAWAAEMLCGAGGFREADSYMPVRISTSEGEFTYSVGDLADGSHPEPLRPSCTRNDDNENSIRRPGTSHRRNQSPQLG